MRIENIALRINKGVCMKIKLILFVGLLFGFNLLSMELTQLSIQDLIDSNTLPEFSRFEIGYLPNDLYGYDFTGMEISSLKGIENLAAHTREQGGLNNDKDIELLIFDSNNITNVPADAFGSFPNLIFLRIKNNPVRSIDQNTFVPLKKLKYLMLDDLFIKKLDPHTFDTLTQLEGLHISRCPFLNLLPNTLAQLHELKTLELRNINLTKFSPAQIKHMKKLQTLNLIANKLEDIPLQLVEAAPSRLYLRGNPIKFLDDPVVSLINKRKIWTDLPRTLFKPNPRSVNDLIQEGLVPAVENKRLNLSNYYLTSLNGLTLIENIATVTELHLNNNYLTEIPDVIWEACPLLKKLFLNENQISAIDIYSPVPLFITHLNLHGNVITRIRKEDFELLKFLENLNLRDNLLSSLDRTVFTHLTGLQSIDLSKNQIKHIDAQTFEPCKRSLNYINLDHNFLFALPLFYKKSFLTIDVRNNTLSRTQKERLPRNIYSMLFYPQSIPQLKVLAAIQVADSFAKLSPEEIAHKISKGDLNNDTLELVFHVAQPTVKEKISTAWHLIKKTEGTK